MTDDTRQQVAEALNIAHLPVENQLELIEQLNSIITKRILADVLDKLPDHLHPEIQDIFEKRDEDKLRAFAKQYLPEYDLMVEHAALAETKHFLEAQLEMSA